MQTLVELHLCVNDHRNGVFVGLCRGGTGSDGTCPRAAECAAKEFPEWWPNEEGDDGD